MRTSTVFFFITLGALTDLTLACDTSSEAESPDADGIPQWQADSLPAVDIAGAKEDGSINFERPVWATRLPSAEIVVADQWGASLRFFNQNGKLIRTAGRHGNGPGEFGRPMWLGRCGSDSLFVSDAVQKVVKVFDQAGSWTRDFTPQSPNGRDASNVLACSDDERFAFVYLVSFPGRDGEDWIPARGILALNDASGNVVAEIGELPFFNMNPVDQITQVALSNDRVYVGTGDSAWIDVYSIKGDTLSSFAVGAGPRPVTEAHLETAIDEWGSQLSGRDDRAQFAEMASGIPQPDHLPFYSGLRLDSEGLLWVVLSVPGDPETHLRAFDEAGEVVAELYVPEDMTVFEVGSDYVLGKFDDEMGEWHVGVFRFSRGS